MSVYKHNNFSYIGNKFTGSQCLGTGMTPFAVQFTFKNECSYSYVSATCMTPSVVCHVLE
ncbi:MAG: hypothetical protein ACEY3B_04910 [Wolbachia sp.]